MSVYTDLTGKKSKLAVVGLGYVGLPLALEFARKIPVIGFDVNPKKVEMMRNGIDPSKEVEPEKFKGVDIVFTSDLDLLKEASFFIVAVPTPVDKYKGRSSPRRSRSSARRTAKSRWAAARPGKSRRSASRCARNAPTSSAA